MTLSVQLQHDFAGFRLDCAFEAPGGVTALSGPSGSGKTTIFQALAGLFRPQSGKIVLNGTLLFDSAAGIFVPPHRRRLGCVFQEARLFPHLSVAQNLRYTGQNSDMARVCDMLGITALLPRRPATLSGGEAQRVAIGRALLSRPEMLLMDEPLSALDEARRGEILPWLERLRDEAGLPILYISHAQSEIARLATTLVRMEAGRVTRAGPVSDLLADPGAGGVGAILTLTARGTRTDGLNELTGPDGLRLWLPGSGFAKDQVVRLQIPARDVLLARGPAEGLSALNSLPARVLSLTPLSEAEVMVQLQTAAGVILARITHRSAREMSLGPGSPVQAIIKAVAL